ncbi:helix-turn-helix domain-containing protein [Apilactobacillus sp. TMW 2.2459]|uniref:helix-turn-helix domain-containing protein n=1 Tax=Apilactobacillus xinyiensis TaxID=2841032 RepID=UPI00201098C9|nr:helix-turn-helix domain-containing protein [Apilactobacillus xinyiensis]MCL0312915.1 helix-turn-helix domain-containing protein [Apilactobacillus xinyiensis]
MANQDLRDKMLINRLPQWKVAEQIGVSEPTIYRWLRTDMDKSHKIIVDRAINDLIDSKAKAV